MREWLKDLRLSSGYTQEKLAKLLKVSRAYYTQIELGNRTPSPKVAMELGKILNFNWANFFEE